MNEARFCRLIHVSFLCCFLGGCGEQDEIKVYRVSKPDAESSTSSGNSSGTPGSLPPMEAGAATASSAPDLLAKIPASWEKQPLSSMRQASFLVKGSKGSEADISLVILGGPAGGALDNVNRWLAQLGQPPISAEQLEKMAEHVASSIGDVTVVDLVGLPTGADVSKDGRILAGFAFNGSSTFFFKMRGNAELAEAQKENFIEWIRSLKIAPQESSGLPPLTPPSGESSAAGPVSSADPTPASGAPQWELPEGWKPAPLTAMLLANFSVDGKNGEQAHVTVVVLPGEAGTDLDNVNRWRGQVGLDPIESGALSGLMVRVKGQNGDFTTVDLPGPKARTVAAWIRLDGQTWFFKLNGMDQVVSSEKSRFNKFLQSVQFH